MYSFKKVLILGQLLLSVPSFALIEKQHQIWDSNIIENELAARKDHFDTVLKNKLNEVVLYISKNDLKAASSVLTLIKAKTEGRDPLVNYFDAYIDSRLNRKDSAIRTLKKIDDKSQDLTTKTCFLWLKILWDEKRWQEVQTAMQRCQSTLSEQSKDELFYTKNLLNLYTTNLNLDNIVPSPFFYFYAPDYLKIETWISLLIKTNNEKIALQHLQKIPEESLGKGNVRLLTAIALWNAGDQEGALNLMTTISETNDWNFKRLTTAVALSKNNLQVAWDSNREILKDRSDLWSNQSLQLALAWKMNLIELVKIKDINLKELINYDVEIAPLLAGILFLKGQNEEATKLINQYNPKILSSMEHQIAYWGVRQWISLRNNHLGNFMTDAEQSCEKKVSFGCWMIISGQEKISIEKNDLFPYDAVGDYFRENL